jgi:hypothetical protein
MPHRIVDSSTGFIEEKLQPGAATGVLRAATCNSCFGFGLKRRKPMLGCAVPVNSTHPDYDASALKWSRIRAVDAGGDPLKPAGVKRFPKTIFSDVFEAKVPVFAVLRRGFLRRAARRKTYAIVSRMTGITIIHHEPPVRLRYTISDGPQTPTLKLGWRERD